MMMVFPAAIAMAMVQKGTIKGKLNGTIETITPSGDRESVHVIPRDTSRVFPRVRRGMDIAYSTFEKLLIRNLLIIQTC